MKVPFARRIEHVHRSFIREILHFAADPDIISFAGGLPNPDLFPIAALEKAGTAVLREDGRDALQYSTSEGYLPLRRFIAQRYKKTQNLDIAPEEIIITTGSQQGIDLVAKVFLNEGDGVIIEEPGYLGAIQALSFFMPAFHPVSLLDDGVDIDRLEQVLGNGAPRLYYTVSNFQNPSGISYSEEKRRQVAELLKEHPIVLLEDNPYGELRFIGDDVPLIKSFLGDQALLLGSFSKIVAPSLRLGWICGAQEIMDRIIVPKQAADLHTNYLSQRTLHRYLMDNDLDAHIRAITRCYRTQRDAMVDVIERQFPEEVSFTKPEGGMFLWVTLPEGCSAMELFRKALEENVAFVPGEAFHLKGRGANTLRLNYSNVNVTKIEEGMRRLARIIKESLEKAAPVFRGTGTSSASGSL